MAGGVEAGGPEPVGDVIIVDTEDSVESECASEGPEAERL